MVKQGKNPIIIDLDQFKLHLNIEHGLELSFHFGSPSRRFYLSVVALVVNEMKNLGKITSIPLDQHQDTLALLNETVGGSAGSSKKENLLPRIYRKWKIALPNLEGAPLFRVLGRKKEYDDGVGKTYRFSEEEKDIWANLFEYKGSEENVRLRFSVDKLGVSLSDVVITYGQDPNLDDASAWDRFIESLKKSVEDKPEPVDESPIRTEPGTAVSGPDKLSRFRSLGFQKTALIVFALLLVGFAAAMIWRTYFGQPPSSRRVVADRHSIAVLPFTNMTGEPEKEYLADGISENIITALAKIPEILVIARNSTFVYKGRPLNIRQIAEELKVQYILEGAIQVTGNRLRVTTQLVDADSEYHLWAESFDRDLSDFFAVQDEITLRVLKELQMKLTEGEGIRLRSDTKNLEAWICFTKARTFYKTFRKEEYAKGIKLLECAVELDPEYASAWALLGLFHYDFYRRGWSDASEFAAASRKRGIELVDKALEMDEYNITALNSRATMYLHKKQWDNALEMLEKSIAAAPGNSATLGMLSKHKFCLGKFEEAIEYGKEVIRLDPFHSSWQLWYLARAYNWSGRYKEGLEVYERILKLCEKENCSARAFASVHSEMAMSYMGLGMEEEARTQIVESLRLHPKGASLEERRNYFSKKFRDQSHVEKIVDALRRAGAPE
jgi:TolB-like protein